MSINSPIKAVNTELVVCLDAGNLKSYPTTGTTWVDLTKNGRNGTLTNGPTFSATNGGAIVFDGTNDYVAVSPMYNFSTTNELTAIIWAKSAVSTWNEYGFLLSKRDQFVIHPNISAKTVGCYVNTTTGGWQAATVTASDITVFNQYAMTFVGGTVYAYLNGVLSATNGSAGSTLSSDTGDMYIGWDDGISGRYLNGSVGLVMTYNRALTSDEILRNYNSTKTRYGL
jgi:hypothetical protein